MSEKEKKTFNVVEFPKPSSSEEIAKKLSDLAEKAALGAFEYVMLMLVSPDGSWGTIQAGSIGDPLRAIGLLESFKADILESSSRKAESDPDLAS